MTQYTANLEQCERCYRIVSTESQHMSLCCACIAELKLSTCGSCGKLYKTDQLDEEWLCYWCLAASTTKTSATKAKIDAAAEKLYREKQNLVTEGMIRNSKRDVVEMMTRNMASKLPSSGKSDTLTRRLPRTVKEIPCIQISASDWLACKDVREWASQAKNGVPRLWCDDVFTVYDHGEGPHSPVSDPEYAMPQWLWDEIDKIMKEQNIGYAVVRLLNEE